MKNYIIENYKSICKEASTNDSIFQIFRQHDYYTPILEHVSYDQGLEYLKVIQKQTPHLLNYIEKFKENDKWGSPKVFYYENIGNISPTTLRYIKVLSDIIKIFESLDGENIIEIGGGYGGQCKIISCLFKFKNYQIIDLPEVVPLINRYLNGIENAKAITLEEFQDIDTCDFFISNYAFTELPKEFQKEYFERIINKSKHGYITCNFISECLNIISMNKDELLSNFKQNYVILNEIPLTHPKNFLIVW